MKTKYIVLLWVGLGISVQGGENVMSERAASLMTALNVKWLDDKAVGSYASEAFTDTAFTEGKGLIVHQKTTPVQLNIQFVDELVLSDQNGNEKCNVKLTYHNSAQEAQRALFERLAMNSLPMNLLLERYQIDEKGPGDLCLIDNLKPRIHFVRGNVIVSVVSFQSDVKEGNIAREIDEKLVGRK